MSNNFRFEGLTLTVSDVQCSVDFYSGKLGLEVAMNSIPAFAMLRHGAGTIGLLAMGEAQKDGVETSTQAQKRATQFSIALSYMKPEFTSIYCYTDEQSLVFVSTDSSRLSEKKILFKKTIDQVSILIPGKNIIEIIRAFENINEEITIYTTKNQISFHTEFIHITSRLIDGIFPDYKQIFPKQFLTEVVILRQDIIDRLKLTTVFSGKLQQIRLKIYPNDKLLEIESRNDDIGETTHQIDATLKGEDVEFLLNQRFLMDVFSYLTADSISLSASGNGKPLVIKGVGDHSFTYLVMPMKG